MSEYEGKYSPEHLHKELHHKEHYDASVGVVHARFRLAEDTRVTGFSRQKKDGSGWEYMNGNRVKLYPVQGEPFGDATPNGELMMTILNPEAAKIFTEAEMGQEYDIMISPVRKAE